MKTKLSIIIVSYNTKKLLADCLNSVYSHKPNFDFEIIVIDNNSKDKSQEMIQKDFPDVTLIQSKENLGFAKANNLASKNAHGEYFLCLNSDTIIKDKSIEKMVLFLENHPNIGIVSPKLVLKNHKIQPYSLGYRSSLGRVFKQKFANFLSKLHVSKSFLQKLSLEYWDWSEDKKVDWVTGAALIIRKSLFQKINGFDEDFFMYFEDQDLCLKAQKAGFETWILPNLEVIHLGGQSFKMDDTRKKMYYKSQEVFFKKHYSKFDLILLKLFSFPFRI